MKLTKPLRGEVWEVQFAPAVGAEIRKLRPAVILNPDGVGRLPLRIVVPITEWSSTYTILPWFVRLLPIEANGLKKESGVDTFQVKSLSLDRFVRRIGRLTDEEVNRIAAAVAFCVGHL